MVRQDVYHYVDNFSLFPFADPTRGVFADQHVWIACYAVPGAAEGHWVHIDFINSGVDADGLYRDTRRLFAYGKTMKGIDAANKVANACTLFFNEFFQES